MAQPNPAGPQSAKDKYFGHKKASEDMSYNLIPNQGVALVVGIVLTFLLGVPAVRYGLNEVGNVLGHLIWFILAAYVVAAAVQFWVNESWRNGLTTKELTFSLLWPADVVRSMIRGVRATNGDDRAFESDDTGEKIMDEQTAKWFGVGLVVLAFPLGFIGVFTAIAFVASLLWLLFITWTVGFFVQFWVAQSWRDGLTMNELTAAVIWPIGMVAVIREGVQARKATDQANPSPTGGMEN